MVAKKVAKKPRYKRILLKLSGEAFRNKETGESLDPDIIVSIAHQIKAVHKLGVEIAIVIGGGNIFRGLSGEGVGVDRTTGDYMGMLATVINSLALQSALEKMDVDTRVLSAVSVEAVAETFIRRRAMRHMEKGRVIIISGGTGNPYFTTDSAAALRASEINADVVLKATKVDGIYTSDPVKNPRAKRYDHITYHQALRDELKIMDAAAFSLCQENDIPILVFNFFKKNEIMRAVLGQKVGTIVDGRKATSKNKK